MNRMDLKAFSELVTRITRLECAKDAQAAKIKSLEAEVERLKSVERAQKEAPKNEELTDSTLDKWFNGVPDESTGRVKLI